MRTQVAIIGAGPAGLLLGHLLRQAGIDAVVVERQTPRPRALPHPRRRAGDGSPPALMERLGLDARLQAEGLPHDGFNLADGERLIRIDVAGADRPAGDGLRPDRADPRPDGRRAGARPRGHLRGRRCRAARHRRRCALAHLPRATARRSGSTRASSPAATAFTGLAARRSRRPWRRTYERDYPFGWLGILADVPPCNHELIYANHERGFALASMRSRDPQPLLYRGAADERLEDWPDERFWDELAIRLGPAGRRAHDPRPRHREVDRAAALLRLRADAIWPPVPVRRRRPYRAADRRQGPEPRRRRTCPMRPRR